MQRIPLVENSGGSLCQDMGSVDRKVVDDRPLRPPYSRCVVRQEVGFAVEFSPSLDSGSHSPSSGRASGPSRSAPGTLNDAVVGEVAGRGCVVPGTEDAFAAAGRPELTM